MFVKRSGSLEVPFVFIVVLVFVRLSSVDDGVKVDAIVAGTSMESCWERVFSGKDGSCVASGTLVGTLEARLRACCIYNT